LHNVARARRGIQADDARYSMYIVLRSSRNDGAPVDGALRPAIAVMAGGLTAPARAEYPDRPVHVTVPVAAGGGVDVMAPLLVQRLGERLHQSFVVENKPGAAGVIGSEYVIAAPADGYTLLYTPSSLSLAVVVHQTPRSSTWRSALMSW
jgi:tripartite-type tricarboxylate transporter receptor subunit TctC